MVDRLQRKRTYLPQLLLELRLPPDQPRQRPLLLPQRGLGRQHRLRLVVGVTQRHLLVGDALGSGVTDE